MLILLYIHDMGAITGKKLDRIECPLCGVVTGAFLTRFEKHLNNEHSTSTKITWDKLNNGPKLCGCGCGSETTFISWKTGYQQVIIGHNANLVAFHGKEKAKEISEKRAESLRGQPGWSKGLTKDNDERIKLRGLATSQGRKKAFQEGSIKIWNKGLTASTDERVLEYANQIKEDFETGKRISWHKGLTEANDSRLLKKNEDLREKYKTGELKQWHKGLTISEDSRLEGFWKNRDVIKEFSHIRWSNDQIIEQLKINTQLRLDRIDGYKNDRTIGLWVRCTKCNWFEKVTLIFARGDKCPKCAPVGSKGQHEVSDWIQNELKIPVGRNVRGIIGRQELDTFIPSHNMAIEYNGLYWHSELAGRDSKYHSNKSDQCKELKISLFHVFEDEWRDKPEIIKSMIMYRLGQITEKIAARKCKTVTLTPKQKKQFFNENHIDGDTASTHAIGLNHNGIIVGAISLRRPFHRRYKGAIEIARICTKTNTVVQGGLSKLTSEAKSWAQNNNYERLISYVDLRHGETKNWDNAGWNKIGESSSRFWWTDFNIRFNRFKFKADKSRNMTEAQVADEAEVVKIWGCGNLVYELLT